MLVGLLPDDRHLVHAQETLKAAGLGAGEVSALVRPAEVWERLRGRKKLTIVFRYVFAGAMLGVGVGALYGVPAGIMNCVVMGCSFTTSAILLAVITLYWVLGGAFVGAIIGADRLEQNLYSYVEGVRHGAPLLVVETPDEQASEVTRILREEGGLLVHSIERG